MCASDRLQTAVASIVQGRRARRGLVSRERLRRCSRISANLDGAMTRAARFLLLLLKALGYLSAILGVAAGVLASYALFWPLSRAVNCFVYRDSSWPHSLESIGWSAVAVTAMMLALMIGRRAGSRSGGVRAFILWCESIVISLLLVPVLLFSSPPPPSPVSERAPNAAEPTGIRGNRECHAAPPRDPRRTARTAFVLQTSPPGTPCWSLSRYSSQPGWW